MKKNQHETSSRGYKPTLYVQNRAQAALFDWEMRGQLSDGRWENSQPFEHWKVPVEAVVVVRPAKVGRNFHVVRGYNFGERELFEAVGERMTRFAKVAQAFPEVSIEDLGEFRHIFDADLRRSLDHYSADYAAKCRTQIAELLKLVGVPDTDAFESKLDQVDYTEKQCRRDASKLTTCFRTFTDEAEVVASLPPSAKPIEVKGYNDKPQPRYFNVAAITTDARTISSQVWTADPHDALQVLHKWLSPDNEKWSGRIAQAAIHDMQTGETTHYRRDGVGLSRLDNISNEINEGRKSE